jgi:hypothetical protein
MRRAHLNIDILERRDVPVTFGIPWANPSAVTLSFAPDGTNVDGSSSQLSALMDRSGLSTSVWQNEILKAVQAWTSQANVNVGVVSDDGSAIGTAGYEQANPRFGDVRIFAAPLASDLYSLTVPSGDLGGTRIGDIILNSNYNFGVGSGNFRDLYTVMLQEVGNGFGVSNSADTSSVMYEFYQGPRTGPTATDIANFRAIYGARPTRTLEPDTGNDDASTATPLAGTGSRLAYGDIASAADADWYTFTAAADDQGSVHLQTAGLSLLSGRLTVFDANMNQIGSSMATGPGQDLTVPQVQFQSGAVYYARVDAAPGTLFAAGQYRLRVNVGGPTTLTLGGPAAVDDDGTNETTQTATVLDNLNTTGGAKYAILAHLRSNDVDVYQIHSPTPGSGQANVLTAAVRAYDDIAPEILISDANGLPATGRVTVDGNGLYTVVVANAAAEANYFVAVHSRTGAAGDYDLHAAFRSQATVSHLIESDPLSTANPSATGSLSVIGSVQMYFSLSAVSTSSVTLNVYDSNNQLRFQITVPAGSQTDGVILLSAGTYRIVVTASTPPSDGQPTFGLATAMISDPIGVSPSDPNDPGSSNPPPSGYDYYNDRGFWVWGERTPTGGG